MLKIFIGAATQAKVVKCLGVQVREIVTLTKFGKSYYMNTKLPPDWRSS